MAQLICEHSECTTEHDLEVSHSMLVVLQKVDSTGYQFFQCEEGQTYQFVNWQHFHCSHKHMVASLPTCLNEHYAEEKLHPIPVGVGTTILHKIVLGSKLACKMCGSPLTSVAYRFCLTMATPINHVPDSSLEDTGEWCCSLDHARQSALAIVASVEY